MLLDSKFYSVLYYNASIWLTPDLSPQLMQEILSISSDALQTCLMNDNVDVSFDSLHANHEKCTPKQIALFQLALQLHKTVNVHPLGLDFEQVSTFNQIVCTRRQSVFQVLRNNKSKIGRKMVANKFYHLNGN